MIRRRGKRAHQLKFVYPQTIIAVVIDSIDATICRGACRGAGITIRFTDTERDLQYLFLILIRYCTCIITRRRNGRPERTMAGGVRWALSAIRIELHGMASLPAGWGLLQQSCRRIACTVPHSVTCYRCGTHVAT
jgi:hypothetical protein